MRSYRSKPVNRENHYFTIRYNLNAETFSSIAMNGWLRSPNCRFLSTNGAPAAKQCTVLVTDHLPELRADLVAALAALDVHELTHGAGIKRLRSPSRPFANGVACTPAPVDNSTFSLHICTFSRHSSGSRVSKSLRKYLKIQS